MDGFSPQLRYFKMVHPQWSMLDPNLHTVDFVRHQSALLTTTILALGSIALATLPDSDDAQVAEALKLRAHAEKLSLVVYSTGARSLEIVQAQVVRRDSTRQTLLTPRLIVD
jgi:hypothetical protein